MAGFFAALVAALWAYDGWNDLNMVAGEIRNPQRNIPLSLIWGVATVGALYILVNAAVQYVLPAAAVAASERPCIGRGGAGAGPRRRQPGIGGHGGFDARDFEWHHHERSARALCHGARWIFFQGDRGGSSALPHAVGGDHCAVRAGDRSASAGRQFPAVLFAGDFRGVDVLHDRRQHRVRFPRREPNADRPYRVWGYPVVPALFVLAPRPFFTTPSPTI
jgi:basic amino acid/polyamine antiporter, APA family